MPGARRRRQESGRRRDSYTVRVGELAVDPLHIEAMKAPDLGLDRRRSLAFEKVDAEVMVISVPAEKAHHAARFGHQLHTHRLVKSL